MSRYASMLFFVCLLLPTAPPQPPPDRVEQRPINPRYDDEVPFPGDRRVNEGAQGRINATIEEQDRALGPPVWYQPPLSW